MPAPYSTFMRCSLGGAEFQLEDYSVKNEPNLDEGLEVGRSIEIQGEGFVEAADVSAFATNLAATDAGFEVRGQDVRVYGLTGQLEYELLAAQCVTGGPYVSFERLPQRDSGAMRKRFRFTVRAEKGPGTIGGEGEAGSDTRKTTLKKRPDHLLGVTKVGNLVQPNAQSTYVSGVLADALAAYPYPNWVVTDQVEVNAADNKLSYSIQAEQLANPLPDLGTAVAVDGTASIREDHDENMNQLVTYSYDLLIGSGNAMTAINNLRQIVQAAELAATQNVSGSMILRESQERTFLREVRARAGFTFLRSRNADGILEWESSVEVQRESVVGRPETYDGVRTVIIYSNAPAYRLQLTGRAVGIGRFVRPPSVPPVPGYVLAEPATPRFTHVDYVRRQTEWGYILVGDRAIGDADLLALMALFKRPGSPQFYISV